MGIELSDLKRVARITGFWYLLWAITGMYSVMYVTPKIIVSGDAVATGANMLAHEFLFKTHIITDFLSIVLTLVLVWALYRLFKQVSERQAKFMVALLIVTLPAAFIMAAFNIASLMIYKGQVLTTFELAQRQDLGMFFLKLNDYATTAFTAFWGLWLFPMAILVYKSRFLPRLLGVWLAINGLVYVVLSLTSLLWPSYRSMVFNYGMPAMFGELAFAIWLVARGANVLPLRPAGAVSGAQGA